MATAAAIRGYVVTLRRGQKISQDTVAERSGLKRRAYILWETGISTDIKVPVLLNALEAVGGWAPHLYQLIDCTEEQGVDPTLTRCNQIRRNIANIPTPSRYHQTTIVGIVALRLVAC